MWELIRKLTVLTRNILYGNFFYYRNIKYYTNIKSKKVTLLNKKIISNTYISYLENNLFDFSQNMNKYFDKTNKDIKKVISKNDIQSSLLFTHKNTSTETNCKSYEQYYKTKQILHKVFDKKTMREIITNKLPKLQNFNHNESYSFQQNTLKPNYQIIIENTMNQPNNLVFLLKSLEENTFNHHDVEINIKSLVNSEKSRDIAEESIIKSYNSQNYGEEICENKTKNQITGNCLDFSVNKKCQYINEFSGDQKNTEISNDYLNTNETNFQYISNCDLKLTILPPNKIGEEIKLSENSKRISKSKNKSPNFQLKKCLLSSTKESLSNDMTYNSEKDEYMLNGLGLISVKSNLFKNKIILK